MDSFNTAYSITRAQSRTGGGDGSDDFGGMADGERAKLRPAFFRRCGCLYLYRFPRALWTLHFRLVAVFDAIVLVRIADCAERFVVEAGESERFFQLFGELLQCFQMIGRCRHFGLRRLHKLLIAAIDQLRNLAADQVSGIGENFYAAVVRLLYRRRAVVLLQEYTRLRAGSLDQIKAVITEPSDRVFVSSLFNFRCHFYSLNSRLSNLDAVTAVSMEPKLSTTNLKTKKYSNASIDIPF